VAAFHGKGLKGRPLRLEIVVHRGAESYRRTPFLVILASHGFCFLGDDNVFESRAT
jgi:hypothetical protein